MSLRIVNKLWAVIFIIIILWVYFLFISPNIFNKSTIVIPDVIGLSEKNAVEVLEEGNINYQITYIQSSNEKVLKTIPYSGVNIKKDYVIDLYIGKVFPKSYSSFLGLVYEDVKADIELLCNDYGIVLELKYVEDNNFISGVIIAESFMDGYIMKSGDVLTLTISKNNSYFVMPNLVGLSIYDALDILKEYNIKPIINYYASPIDKDIVLFQSIVKDSIVKKGNLYEITLYVSKGIEIFVNVCELEEMLVFLGYDVKRKYINSNEEENILVAFEVKKLYDSNELLFTLIITE